MEQIDIQDYKDMEHSAIVFDNSPIFSKLKNNNNPTTL